MCGTRRYPWLGWIILLDSPPIISYTRFIMSRKITLNIKGESSKQYTTLILELNIMAKAWNKYGVNITLPGKEKIIKWGQKTGKDTPTEAPE